MLFVESDANHVKIAALGMQLTRKQQVSLGEYKLLDEYARAVVGI